MSLGKLYRSASQKLTKYPASFIPPSPTGGVLPYWMLLISSAAFYNVAQSYVVLWQTKEIYGKKPEQGMSLNPIFYRIEAGE